jgi:hypothetical protein
MAVSTSSSRLNLTPAGCGKVDPETIQYEHPGDDPDNSNYIYGSEGDDFDGGRSTFYTARIDEVDHRMS